MMIVAIGGCRNFYDRDLIFSELDAYFHVYALGEEITILSGHGKGVDRLIEEYATERQYALKIFPAEWNRYGRAAGPIRNSQMVEEAERVIAFWDLRSKGTASLIRLARAQKKLLHVIEIPST